MDLKFFFEYEELLKLWSFYPNKLFKLNKYRYTFQIQTVPIKQGVSARTRQILASYSWLLLKKEEKMNHSDFLKTKY